MAYEMTNPRFPHKCRIYRQSGATNFSRGEEKTIIERICRKSASDNIRTFNTGSNTTGKVDTTDYRISVPGIVMDIQKGDFVDVQTLMGTESRLRVVSYNASMLGKTQITEDGKTITVTGCTELLCNAPSN